MAPAFTSRHGGVAHWKNHSLMLTFKQLNLLDLWINNLLLSLEKNLKTYFVTGKPL